MTLAPVDISRTKLGDYLRAVLGRSVDVLGLRALGGDGRAADPKALGYGAPFEVDCVVDDVRRSYVVCASGELVPAGDATQFFQLVEKAEGDLYWLDLERLRCAGARLTELDLSRAESLARFLAEAHSDKRDDPALYTRRLRELVGHGECLMGILDSYPHPYPPLPQDVCESLEHDFVSWRWRLRTD